MNSFFFGAGRLGRYWLSQWKNFKLEPDGILDNHESLWGTMCDGVMVFSPDRIKEFDFDYIFVTCRNENEIIQQLLDLEIPEKSIVSGDHNIINHMFYYAAKKMISTEFMEEFYDSDFVSKVLFDLQNGMVLGGVEAWSYDLAKRLKETGHQGVYLAADPVGEEIRDETYPVCTLSLESIEKQKNKIELCIKEISKNLPCTIICNFPQHIFWSACFVKGMYPEKVRIIAVQHSDDRLYYNAYSLWQEYIDRCMVISSAIEHKLLSFGMEQNKIVRLEWNIFCKDRIDRQWSRENTCLQIGYAGRVTMRPKRVDLFIPLAEKLKRIHVNFHINIAGTGNYGEKLKEKIQEEGLQDCMTCIGYIDRQDIPDFWSRQDIMISCSEWEGHSISQSEAMAEGAVPVITDVSGARDDVTDGYNGYVVNVGDIDALADRIQELYLNRDKLEQMGIRAHNTICRRQKNRDQTLFWDDLIKKVWQK